MSSTPAVIFDLFGTLIYLAHETKPYTRLFVELGLKTAEEFASARRIALTESFANLGNLVARINPNTLIDLNSYEGEIEKERSSARLYPETKRVLEELRTRGVKLGLISNLASPYQKPFFDLGLDQYFERVLFSCNIGIIKPDSRIYLRMVQELKIEPSQGIMVGDKLQNDVEGPKIAGITGILLDRNNQHSSPIKINSLEGIFHYL